MYTEYAMWGLGHNDWCVVAHERVGDPDIAVISVQFVPPKKPSRVSTTPPVKTETRELELA